jgi:hypothetical protein
MLRVVAFWCSVLAVFFCGWGWVENTWAAGFEGPYRPVFVFRAEVFLGLLCASLLASLILALRWMRLAVRRCCTVLRGRLDGKQEIR